MRNMNLWDCFNVNKPWATDGNPCRPIDLFGCDNIGNYNFTSMGGDEMSIGANGQRQVEIYHWHARINFRDSDDFKFWAQSVVCQLAIGPAMADAKDQLDWKDATIVGESSLYDLYERRCCGGLNTTVRVPTAETLIRVRLVPFWSGEKHPTIAPNYEQPLVWIHLEGVKKND